MTATLTIAPSVARPLCLACILSGKPSPELRAWVQYQANEADDTATDRVGALRVALWWLADADVSWRLIAHAGQALADALLNEGEGRAERYSYQVGSAGQVRG